MIELEKKMTWQELRFMEIEDDDRSIYELINGGVVSRKPHSLMHQRVSRNLSFKLGSFLKKERLGEYFYGLIDVRLDEYNGVVPDLLFITNERLNILENEEYVDGAPDLIVEIISPETVKRDRIDKKDLYERFAVKEY